MEVKESQKQRIMGTRGQSTINRHIWGVRQIAPSTCAAAITKLDSTPHCTSHSLTSYDVGYVHEVGVAQMRSQRKRVLHSLRHAVDAKRARGGEGEVVPCQHLENLRGKEEQ